MRRDGLVQRVPEQRLPPEADVAVGVGDRAAQQRDVDGLGGAVVQVVDAADLHDAHGVVRSAPAPAPAAGPGAPLRARVDEGADADAAQRARPARGAVAEHVRHGAERQVDPLDGARAQVRAELGAEADPRVREPGQQGRHGEAAEAAPCAVADGGDDDGAEPPGRARRVVPGAQSLDQGLRKARADEAADLGERVDRWRRGEEGGRRRRRRRKRGNGGVGGGGGGERRRRRRRRL